MSELHTENQHGVTVLKRRTSEELLFSNGPFATVLHDVLEKAHSMSASDIHIEPTADGIDFRIRVHGEMLTLLKLGEEFRSSLILEAKRIFNLPVGVSGEPRDSRASFPKLSLDVRVSLLPTYFGEKIVLRLLPHGSRFDLDTLGFLPSELAVLKACTQFENGVVVISGPTGSGKSKTLYSLLNSLGPSKLNITSLEDPIEYRIPGVNQVSISSKLTFADGLRSVLRQDPDVILVGEVRDEETAKLCFQAAETGHLVFTTLHANGAVEVAERLGGLGTDRYAVNSLLRATLAQRLEAELCPHCRVEAPPNAKAKVAKEYPEANCAFLSERDAIGCERCGGGVVGRVPILEWARTFRSGPKTEIKVMRSLREGRLERALKGTIALSEVSLGDI